MKTATRIWAVLGLFLLAAGAGRAQISQIPSVADGSGARSSGGDLEHVSAGAQPGGIGVARSGTMLNYAGFLGGAMLCPGLDRDGDGLADEIDPDNDGDVLWDLDELDGSAFAPLTATDLNEADTDGDGATDGEEAGAQTDPLDPDVFLHFTRIGRDAADDVALDWMARQNWLYRLYRYDPTNGLPGTYVDAVRAPAVGGVGLWAVVTAAYTNAGMDDRQTYYLEVVGP
ncbi:MAG: thrombospondin type 3 repeat-containing protein [Kiritimatiellia bacterium]